MRKKNRKTEKHQNEMVKEPKLSISSGRLITMCAFVLHDEKRNMYNLYKHKIGKETAETKNCIHGSTMQRPMPTTVNSLEWNEPQCYFLPHRN